MPVVNILFTAVSLLFCVFAIVASKNKKRSKGRIIGAEAADKWHYLILAGLLVLGLFVRVYKIDVLPLGLHGDETGAAYDAYALANYGVDRYLKSYPVYLLNYGSGQSALFAYIVMASFKLFGFSVAALRIPMAVFNATSIITGYALVKRIMGRRSALFGAFLITVMPYFMMSARFGLDCYLMMPAFTLSLWLLIKAVDTSKARWFALCGTALGITLYSYALSYMILPIFLFLVVVYLVIVKSLSLKNLFAIGIPLFLLALPLLLMILVNFGVINEIATPYITIPKLVQYRGGEIAFKHIGSSFNYILDVFSHDTASYASYENFHVLYLMSMPFVALGFGLSIRETARSIREKSFSGFAIIIAAFVSVMACMLLMPLPTIYKANAVYITLLVFAVTGIRYVCGKLKPALIATTAMYCICFVALCVNYFVIDVSITHAGFYAGAVETYSMTREMFPEKTIYVLMGGSSISYEWSYTFTLLADQESPYSFNDTKYKYAGTTNYGKNRFYMPVVVSDAVYMLRFSPDNQTHIDLVTEFEARGFQCIMGSGDFRIYYLP